MSTWMRPKPKLLAVPERQGVFSRPHLQLRIHDSSAPWAGSRTARTARHLAQGHTTSGSWYLK